MPHKLKTRNSLIRKVVREPFMLHRSRRRHSITSARTWSLTKRDHEGSILNNRISTHNMAYCTEEKSVVSASDVGSHLPGWYYWNSSTILKGKMASYKHHADRKKHFQKERRPCSTPGRSVVRKVWLLTKISRTRHGKTLACSEALQSTWHLLLSCPITTMKQSKELERPA